ncbi:MAG: THUMP domain-containing protein [Flavobacteriales bacterium]
MTAQTMFGLEEVLARELEAIGAQHIEVRNRAVRFTGDLACLYRANLCLRTALRILIPLESFHVRHEEDLYNGIRRMRWEEHLGADDTLAVGCTLHSDRFNHSQYLALKAKDAIVDRFRDRTGRRPSVDLERPTVRIHLHVHGDACLVSLDSSGGSLHKRGYRDHTNLAPINEVLAAGLVLLTGWDGSSPLVDPMCGSGTLLIEAALIAANIPPGSYRETFGFQRWHDFDQALWHRVKEEAMRHVRPDGPLILGGELSPHVARKARSNIASAGLKERVEIRNTPFQELLAPAEHGTLILNPPYGERMDNEDIGTLYKSIGDTFKQHWAGWTAWVITSNMEAAKRIHLTPKPRIKVYNGSLECRFLRYELYAGTRRKDKAPPEA